MASGDLIPNGNSVSRYCNLVDAEGNIAPDNFRLRNGEATLSVDWVECRCKPLEEQCREASRERLKKKLTRNGPLHKIAYLPANEVRKIQGVNQTLEIREEWRAISNCCHAGISGLNAPTTVDFTEFSFATNLASLARKDFVFAIDPPETGGSL